MRKTFFASGLFLLLIFITISVYSAVRLPAILGNHMVLEQNSEVKLWGWCAPAEKIMVKTSWDTITYRTTGKSSAKWALKIKTPSAGGPYTITINGSTVLEDVLIGEVWVCSGQSNMEFTVSQAFMPPAGEAPDPNNQNIRFFYIPKSTSEYPQDYCEGSWKVCTPEEMKHFSAIGYYFGQDLQRALNAPIGLINSNWGGDSC